jgi:hypothetical protein
MNPFAENEQDSLAARFHIDETQITQASHLAYLKIQSWKFAMTTPHVTRRFKQEADDMIMQSFFSFVPNSYILSEEGYYFNPLN